ncbi:MAG: hypothetical protein ACRD2A_25725, partial [Vicinamibacterales bacterium]
MTNWHFVIAQADSTHIAELTTARSRKVTWDLDAPATASFTLDGRDANATSITELATDLLVYADNVALFRGRIGASEDDLSADSHRVNFSAIDYRGLLHRRIIWPGSTLSYTTTDQADIAWDLIADSQALTGGNFGIIRNAPLTGVTRTVTLEDGENIGEVITKLGRSQNGFEWDIDPLLKFNLYFPSRGTTGLIPLVWGDNVAHMRRELNPDNFANAIRYSGDQAIGAVTRVAGSFGLEGRWERQLGDPDINNAT